MDAKIDQSILFGLAWLQLSKTNPEISHDTLKSTPKRIPLSHILCALSEGDTPLFHRIPKGLQCFTSFRMLKSLSILSHTQPGWHVPVVIEISAIDRYQLGIDRQHQPDAKAQPVGEDK